MDQNLNLLIKKCMLNDRGGQQELYQLFSPILYGICLKYMKNEDDAKDVFQEAFIIIFQKINQYKFEGSFEGWLKRIFINKCIEALKKRQKEYIFIDVVNLQEKIEDEITIEENSIPEEKLLDYIRELPDQYRIVFNLYIFEKLKHREIAQMLNISEGTSKSNLNRAKGILQKKILALSNIKIA